MQGVFIKLGLVMYNDNPAGYIKDDIAIIDKIFENDDVKALIKKEKLEAKWENGVFENLVEDLKFYCEETNKRLKKVRIWQLKASFDFDVRYVSYEEMIKKHKKVSIENYDEIYDGKIQTNDLEKIYTKFNLNYPKEFKGHPLAMSDVIELYDEENRYFYYVDKIGFKQIDFI